MNARQAFLVASVTALATAACRPHRAEGPAAPEDEIWVQPGQVERGEVQLVEAREEVVRQTVAAAGRIAFDDVRVQHVLSPAAGQVTRILAQLGDRVRRGAPLVALLSPDAGSAFSDVVKAEADLAQAGAELERQERLVKAQAAPRRDLEVAQDVHRKAEAELARAKQKAALLRSGGVDAVNQEYTIRSAIDGEVLLLAVSPGMQVQGAYSGGTPVELLTIGDIDRVWVLADVAEADIARVRPGADADVRVPAHPGRTFHGRVDWIAGSLDPSLRTARVRIALANADHALKPEMLAQVSIAAAAARAILLPRSAIVPVEGEAFTYVREEDASQERLRFKRRRIRVSGDASDSLAIVQDGVSRGDQVLVESAARPAERGGEVRITGRQFEKAGLRVEPVREHDLADTLAASARVTFDDARVGHVFSPVTGRIVRVLAEPGQRVSRGAPLLAILSPDVGAAFADALKARADVIAAGHELARQRDLVEAHAGARRDLEMSEGAWRRANAEGERASQKTRLLAAGTWDAVTQEYTLRSPIAGEVVSRAATPGLEVQGQWSGAGSPVELFTIGQFDPLWVLADVYEMDLRHVRKGLPVVARVPAFPDRTFAGHIDWVSEVIDPATRAAKVRCAIDNAAHLLRPQMAPVLSIALPSEHRLGVPRDAVLRLGDDTVVFVASGETPDGQRTFRRRKVVVGGDAPQGIVPILEGVAAGEQVVVSGGIFLVGLL